MIKGIENIVLPINTTKTETAGVTDYAENEQNLFSTKTSNDFKVDKQTANEASTFLEEAYSDFTIDSVEYLSAPTSLITVQNKSDEIVSFIGKKTKTNPDEERRKEDVAFFDKIQKATKGKNAKEAALATKKIIEDDYKARGITNIEVKLMSTLDDKTQKQLQQKNAAALFVLNADNYTKGTIYLNDISKINAKDETAHAIANATSVHERRHAEDFIKDTTEGGLKGFKLTKEEKAIVDNAAFEFTSSSAIQTILYNDPVLTMINNKGYIKKQAAEETSQNVKKYDYYFSNSEAGIKESKINKARLEAGKKAAKSLSPNTKNFSSDTGIKIALDAYLKQQKALTSKNMINAFLRSVEYTLNTEANAYDSAAACIKEYTGTKTNTADIIGQVYKKSAEYVHTLKAA